MYSLLSPIEAFSGWIVSSLSGALGGGYPILYNVIGVISIVLQILIFQMRDRKQIVTVGIMSDIGWLSYFVLQGDLISGTSGLIGIMSKTIALLRDKHAWAKSKLWNVFFLGVAAVFSLCAFKIWKDIFALLACTSAVLAFFMEDENKIRKISLFTYSMFVCNSLSKGYVVAFIADITALISVIVSLIRYGKKSKEE